MITTNEERQSLLLLYQREIEKVLEILYLDPNKAGDLNQLLPNKRIDELCQECENRKEFGSTLFKELLESPLSNILYYGIMKFLVHIDKFGVLHKLLSLTDENTRKSGFNKVLRNLDGFMKFTHPDKLLNYLESYPSYANVVAVLKEELLKLTDNPEIAKKVVLRTIPQLGRLSIFDVLFVIYTRCDSDEYAEARDFVEKIQPDFMRKFEQLKEERRYPRARIFVCPIESSVTEMMMQIGTPSIDDNPRFTVVDFIWDRMPYANTVERMIIDSIQNRVHMETPLILRDYQRELCEIAVKGFNTIITAPTGCGKTVVAANILKNHFETKSECGRNAKALFMTPNSVILQHQADCLNLYMKHLYRTQIIQGSDNVPTRNAIMYNDIIVATPQLILNLCNEHLTRNIDLDGVVDQFYLSTFSIIIFDECHSTQKNSPYWNIMKIYHKLKNLKIMPEGHVLPQIVGLTASLGVGTSKDIHDAVIHIAELCANMDVERISVVQRNIDDLKKFSPIIPDRCVLCPKSCDINNIQFSGLLSEMMQEIEDEMFYTMKINGNIKVKDPNSNDLRNNAQSSNSKFIYKKPPREKDSEGYQGWISNSIKFLSEAGIANKTEQIILYEALEVLQQCYLSHGLNSEFNSKISFDILNDWIEWKKRFLRQKMVQLWEKYSLKLQQILTTENAMIKKVVSLLVEQNDDFRCIIFMKTRNGAEIMSKILNENDELKTRNIFADYISGLNRTSDNSNKSRKTQQETLENFANGSIKVLIATSVAEEGLDVAKCNLVIKYNYATNEIAHVQRRGRGRAANSDCVLVTNNEKLKDQEDTIRSKEILMNSAIEKILSGYVHFVKIVQGKSKDIWTAIQNEELINANIIKRQIDENVSYKILCKKCNGYLCANSDIRSRNTQYFVCTPNVWNVIQITRLTKEEQEREAKFGGRGKVFCKQSTCGMFLGRLLDVNSVNLPCLAAEAIVLVFTKNGAEQRKVVKKWKEILSSYFTPQSLRIYDIELMRNCKNPSFQYSHTSHPTIELEM